MSEWVFFITIDDLPGEKKSRSRFPFLANLSNFSGAYQAVNASHCVGCEVNCHHWALTASRGAFRSFMVDACDLWMYTKFRKFRGLHLLKKFSQRRPALVSGIYYFFVRAHLL